ncbi:MAG: histidine phosphatase family protein [Dehalococcoidia bacterium]|nr:histidine phosphatase family protein [Dehalococcoidia bacterium]
MQLFLVRHGETESNRAGLALGRADLPLNEHGRWQAQRLAEALAAERLAAVYSSPLSRALHTAREIAAPHGLEVREEDGLIELDIGEAEGLTFTEVRERFPELAQNWGGPQGPAFQMMPGGERLVDVQARAWQAVQSLAARHAGERVCAVAHNFVILSVLCFALGISLANFRRLRHSVAAVAVMDVRRDRVRIQRLNDTCHLER